MTVLYGVGELSDYFSRNTTGTGSLPNGYKWQMELGRRSFLGTILLPEAYAKIIKELIVKPPLNENKNFKCVQDAE